MWPLRDPARYQHEQHELRNLEARSSWLHVHDWRYEAGHFCVDVDLNVHGAIRRAVLRYSKGFPHSPPSVLPKTPERWSEHQYGLEDLCLEYRADNWVSTLTGADMIESAYRLLSGEARTDERPAPPPVPSAHDITSGQTLRSNPFRLVITASARDAMSRVTAPSPASILAVYRRRSASSWFVKDVEISSSEKWFDPELPAELEGVSIVGTVVRSEFTANTTVAREMRENYMPDAPLPDGKFDEVLVIVLPNTIKAFWLFDDTAYPLAVLVGDSASRLTNEWLERVKMKRVAIVGCGSVGSKVAAMLVRSGVTKLLLIDDDVVSPENIVRNELSWRDIGAHKADAVARRLNDLRAGLDIQIKRQNLGGQEASSSADSTLDALAACDLIIDATASDVAFNYAAAMAHQHKRPMVWGQVFGGGIGGLVARARPALDPAPQLARAKILAWFNAQPFRPTEHARPYEASGDTALVADDADVSLVASHLARLALDILREPERSDYPHSAYVFGMRSSEALFDQPFMTTPIELGSADDTWSGPVVDEQSREAVLNDLLRIFKTDDDGTPQS